MPEHTIAIYAEDLRGYTSSTPSREMLRHLMGIRPNSDFFFLVRKGSDQASWLREYLASLPSKVRVQSLGWTRREANLRALFGLPDTDTNLPKADLYLRFDAGRLGHKGLPLIDLVADLSALEPGQNSMPWHGKVLFRRGLRHTLQQSSDTVVISEATARAIRQHDPRVKTRLHVIPNGIANEWHEMGAKDSAAPVDEWIWYGQVTARKNLDNLLEAYAALSQQRNGDMPVLRIVAQNSPQRQRWMERVRSKDLEAQIRLEDPLSLTALIERVKASRGLVFPSLHEGFGMPVVEAMACGRPVLTSNVTSMPEVAGGHAVLCHPNDVLSIEAGLRTLLDPAQDTEVARSRRRAHAAQYTAENAAQAYSRLIDAVLKRESTSVKR